MLNAQADTKATSTAESEPDQRAKEQCKANTAAAASAAAGTPNGKAAKAHAAQPSAQARGGKKRKKKSAGAARTNGERKRGRKPYPVVSFADVLPLAEGIMKYAGGQPVKRTTLLETMGLPETSLTTRNLITNSNKYGVTEGNHSAETLKLTTKGAIAVDTRAKAADRNKARFDIAVGDVEEFNALYEKTKGNALLAPRVLHDVLTGVDEGDRQACVDVFTSNVKFLGMLVPRDGAEYLMTVEEWIGSKPPSANAAATMTVAPSTDGTPTATDTARVDFDKMCFVISTIKEDGSEQRKHADMIFSQYVARALEGTGLKPERADKIGDPGMISKQIIEYILKAKLVVADLSFHNPNVFYELALRHVTGKPTVHLTRTQDKPPFDVGNFRAITIDTTSVETAVMQLDTLRAEIGTAITKTLANGESRDNPILTHCPTAKFVVDGQ